MYDVKSNLVGIYQIPYTQVDVVYVERRTSLIVLFYKNALISLVTFI